ncbi:GNAT family N-acetyltransferase [uncultured Enterovirga sp.]|uniref:GNAT family N-acetyltransferase n=1 Tax=uncultured Enterovirga sp. TaxID=2026352 RepID=UPI0035CC7E6D
MLARPSPKPAPASDGLIELPPGKIAAVATYLEMRTTAPTPSTARPLVGRLERIAGNLARYRALYARIGEPWLWFSRTILPDHRLRAILEHPAVEAMALVVEGQDIGLAELDRRHAGECELSFFGLVPEACGQGIGPALMDEAIRRSFARPIRRLWLHTCTLDHPAAMQFYLKCGFRPFRRAIEIADDPRLTGHMRREAAPLFPIV